MPESIRLALLLIFSACLFLTGIGWGLPSRNVDRFLFGDREVWSGQKIAELAGGSDSDEDRAADVSASPLTGRHGVIELNANDHERARIVRRFRLMSYQPDEFGTFAALARMKPGKGDLDPRMYKYGGLWVYPVAGLLKAASRVGIVTLRADQTYYLDHPNEFAKFYVIARLYSALWGLLGVMVVYRLVRRICADSAPAIIAALCFSLMPVVVNSAHEAKPHLAGTVLMLLAVYQGSKFVEKGKTPNALGCAVFCGLAIGMVPSALPVLLVIPAMEFCSVRLSGRNRPESTTSVHRDGFRPLKRTFLCSAVALLIYGLTNPYVIIHLLGNRAVLRSNFGNSAAFYHAQISSQSLLHGGILLGFGISFLLFAAGMIGAISLGVRAFRMRASTSPDETRRRAVGLLLAVATLPVGAAFILYSSRQPADYARFALPVDIFLAIEAVVAIATCVRQRRWRRASYGLLVLSTAIMGLAYIAGFARDSVGWTSRLQAALRIDKASSSGNQVLATRLEPAPWSLPPVNLFRWKLVLVPRDWPEDRSFDGAEFTVGPTDFPADASVIRKIISTPLSWAEKPFSVLGRSPRFVSNPPGSS
jgi:hypothetical protein